MAWNGSGTFTRTNGVNTGATLWASDRDASTKILATRHDTHDQDLATGIQSALTKNNESKPTANFAPNADNSYSVGTATVGWTTYYARVSVVFLGASFKTTLAYTAPTADRTITFPDATGNVLVSGVAINSTSLGVTTPDQVRAIRVREAMVALGTIAAAGTATCDLATGSAFSFTPDSTTSSTVTVAVTNPPASGDIQSFILEIINGRRSADAKITWPASFKWVGGSTNRPLDTNLELSGRNLFSLYTRDGGTRYEIAHLGAGG